MIKARFSRVVNKLVKKFLFLILGIFLLTKVFATPQSQWTFEDLGPQQDMLEKIIPPSTPLNEIKVRIFLDQSLGEIPDSFYAVGISEDQTLPTPTLMKKIPISLMRLGGREHSRYDYRTGAVYSTQKNSLQIPSGRESVDKVRSLGAEPIVTVSLLGYKTMIKNGKMQMVQVDPVMEARETVRYFNGEMNLNIKYFGLDNEPLNWFTEHRDVIQRPLSANELLERYVMVIVAMREEQAKISKNARDIVILGPELALLGKEYQTFSPQDCVQVDGKMKCRYGSTGEFDNFLEYALFAFHKAEEGGYPHLNRQKWPLIDFLSLHFYPYFRLNYEDHQSFIDTGSEQKNLSAYWSSILLWDTETPNTLDFSFPLGPINYFSWLKQIMQRHHPRLQVAITEFGIDPAWLIDYHPLLRPLYNAEMMAKAATHQVSIFSLSYLNSSQYLPMSWSMVAEGKKTLPVFHTYSLMSRFFRGKILKVDSANSAADQWGLYATLKDSQVRFVAFNRSSEKICFQLALVRNSQRNSQEDPWGNHCLPPFSMSTFLIPSDKNQSKLTRYQYGAQQLKTEPVPKILRKIKKQILHLFE